jgi:hypothetical protein
MQVSNSQRNQTVPNDLLETAQASARQSGGATPVLSATHISKHFEDQLAPGCSQGQPEQCGVET